MRQDPRSVEDTFQELGIDTEHLHFDADGTIIHPPTKEEIAALDGTGPLPRLDRPGDPHDPAEHRLTFGSIIGEGAMGVIRSAQQVPLRREVAVKSIRADEYDPVAERALVLEARVTGALEHPNIVPVYSLGLDDGNRPAMVMRRLEGVPWRQFIGQGGHLKTPEPGNDPLEWHLRVLIQVCNAVHYAHIKGVVHRDLKPVNVMIGRFGEVYVLDWGLAVTVDEADLLGLPRASSVDVVIGTPGHMAPEMIDTRKRQIGQRTDVYLLGTCLHMVLTGSPRHDQTTVRERMLSALRSDPVEYGPTVPAELAEICHRAMARDPRDRFPSAHALRQALEAFLTHRVSQRLADEASARTLRLRAMLRHGDHPEEDKVHRLFAECRFGFRQALQEWPENPSARSGLQGLLEMMVSYELAEGDPQRARPLLAELPEPRPQLEARIDERVTAQADKIERLERIQKEVDVHVGLHERSRTLQLMGAAWAAIYMAFAALDQQGLFSVGHGTMLAVSAVHGATMGVFTWIFRDVLRSSRVNRRFLIALWFTVIAPLLFWPLAMFTGIAFPLAVATLMLLYFMAAAMISIVLDLRLLMPTTLYALGAWATVFLPEYALEMLAGTTLASLSVAAQMIRRPQTASDAAE
ncbi:MAG: protein kinase [bacterium]